jgi:hypothetical protein
VVEQPTPPPRARFSPDNWSVGVGGGVGHFARGAIGSDTSVGGAWDVRVGVGTRRYAAFEAQYVGTEQSSDLAFLNDPNFVTHQLTAAFRLNFTRIRFQPFLYGGAGWAWLHARIPHAVPAGTVTFNESVNGGTFPLGGGITGYLGKHAMLEARGSYSFIVGGKDITLDQARPDIWGVQFNAGYAF